MGPYSDANWEPVPLELPLEIPGRRSPATEWSEEPADPDADFGRTVIEIDLA
jgi:hypothetical protein